MSDVNPIRRLRLVTSPSGDDVGEAIDGALTRAGRGDEAAFAEFYDLTSALVYGIVVKVVRNPAIAEEVTQDIYLELWRLAPRFDSGRGSGKSWTCTVAHRRAVDRVRSEQSRHDREVAEGRKSEPVFDQVSETVIDDLDRAEVSASLDCLSPTQKEAVSLAYYGGHTYREVASLLDVPEGTVKTRIRNGLIRLRDEMGLSS